MSEMNMDRVREIIARCDEHRDALEYLAGLVAERDTLLNRVARDGEMLAEMGPQLQAMITAYPFLLKRLEDLHALNRTLVGQFKNILEGDGDNPPDEAVARAAIEYDRAVQMQFGVEDVEQANKQAKAREEFERGEGAACS
jgi:hypothetical protein